MKLRMICTNLSIVKGPPQLNSGESYRVGRSSRCAFVLTDLSVSRQHAEVVVDGRGIHVKDLGSRNGTFVDGLRVKEAELQPGQSVRFGNANFQLIAHDPDAVEHENSEVSTFLVKVKAQPSIRELSSMQRRVLAALLKGKSEKAVATDLHLSPHTVHNHVKEIYRRMAVGSRAELFALFVSGTKKTIEKKVSD